MSTIWSKYSGQRLLTASRWLVSDLGGIGFSLWRIYQQSFMVINCCEWSNSCEAANQEASQGQVEGISTIMAANADLNTVGAQTALRLAIDWRLWHKGLLWYSSYAPCYTNESSVMISFTCTPLCCMDVHGQPSFASAIHQINCCRMPHSSCILLHFQDDYLMVETSPPIWP